MWESQYMSKDGKKFVLQFNANEYESKKFK